MLLVTLFGGVVAVALLYFIFGLLRLPHFWRGVLAGGIPVVAYVIYAMQHWGGGDVLSIHMAVYLATAVGLTLVMSRKREEGKKAHWIPQLFVLFFVVLVVIQANLVYISGQGLPESVARWLLPEPKHKGVQKGSEITTAFSGVVHHGDEAAKSVGAYRSQNERERKLGWKVTVKGVVGMQADVRREIIATVLDRDLKPLHGEVRLLLGHPGEARKQEVPLTEVEAGRYRTELTLPAAGNWSIGLRIKAGNDVLESEQVVDVL